MSNSDIRVVPGPANYFSHPGSLERLSDFFNADQLSRAVWVYGERALAGAEPFLPAAFHLPEAKKIRFTGHCSERDVAGLVQASGDDRAVVIGVGGGTLLDSAKVLARRLGVPLVAIPTIAATCAAWTPLSVWYSDAGQALNFEIFDDANFLVLVEPRIILNAPAEYLLAGIGDTLAKWYEAVVLAPQPEALPLTVPFDGLWTDRTRVKLRKLEKSEVFYKTFNTFCLDCGTIDFESLCVRTRRTGDTLRLTENGGSRSLKKLMIDRKIPRYMRNAMAVIADKNGVIAVQDIGADYSRTAKNNANTLQITVKGLSKNGL